MPETPGWFARHRNQLRLAVRVTVAGLLAMIVAMATSLPQVYWAVFAAVIVTETSVGGSLRAALNWLMGTVGGAAYAALVATYVPHETPVELVIELAIGLAPLVVIAGFAPSLRVAPVTAIIVLATANSPQFGPLQSAIDRVLEIGVGSLIGVIVSLVVLPSRAHAVMADAAGKLLDKFARLITAIIDGLGNDFDDARIQALHFDIIAAFPQLEAAAMEVGQERATLLSTQPDAEPVPRTLHRIRGDMVMISRAGRGGLPPAISARLYPPLITALGELLRFLNECGQALKAHRAAPSLDGFTAAHSAFTQAMDAVREAHLTQGQPTDTVGRVFAFSFALDQLQVNLTDFANRVSERARS
jgi:uncharacterized membrane protein YccC